ncbi:4Fe-4S dicluster domain-containing protein [Desulfosarcina sp. OttesenSCG-928-A07]|nr:4Fe-4S dicluster domain-containing protein [Desulfosarcina sp. OttesenSCG-928-A07]
MTLITLDTKSWAAGLTAAADAYRLFGPVREDACHTFKALEKGKTPDLDMVNTRLSPKALIFPQSDIILEYSLDESREDHHIMREVQKDVTPRAVVGIRPCDAKATALVKLNFDAPDVKDPYWLAAYEATTFVGVACDAPLSTCFCTTAGCGPYSEEGLDILVMQKGDGFLAKILTDKGRAFAKAAGWNPASGDLAAFEAGKAAAEKKMVSAVQTDHLEAADLLALHNAPFWEKTAFACLNCGTCTFSCPTCWCFDLQDEVAGKSGVRLKNWDSCMFPIFTVHTTGHNPRETKVQRVRQRFMHKLKYFVDKYKTGIMCVGCGRCVRQCPVNIDIRKVCEEMNRFNPADACAVRD